MSKLLELAERVEAAAGPDRELDHSIYETLGKPIVRLRCAATHCTDLVNWPPFYTASLDAAMTLMPEGWRWQVESLGVAAVSKFGVQVTSPDPLHSRAAATPALALCAAALRARASIEGGENA